MPGLGRQEAIDYWDERHRSTDPDIAGGDIGLERTENNAFYVRRLGRLLESIGEPSDPRAPHSVLDAGCGTGYFSRGLVECGFRVRGVDSSPSAIATARERGGGPDYLEGSLDEVWLSELYDYVIAVDVVFHIVADDVFASALEHLAHHVRTCGALIVADRDEASRSNLSNYIVHRPRHEYLEILEPLGFRFTTATPYAFRHNPINFIRYDRILT